MPNLSGFVDNTTQLAHYEFLSLLNSTFTAVGSTWQVLRYDTSTDNHELILQGEGLTGLESIYVGFRCYQSVVSDYYNIECATMTGYNAAETFYNQPGAAFVAVCAHNQRIDYWLSWNAQHIKFALKVGTPVYESAYVGKFTPYARPSQYPYPVAVSGTLGSSTATRFSDTSTTHSMGYKGNNTRLKMRDLQGVWAQPYGQPWGNTTIGGTTNSTRPVNGQYCLIPAELYDTSNIYGTLDGVFFIGGFDNAVENTLTIGGVNYVVIQDVFRTGFPDYYALRMEP